MNPQIFRAYDIRGIADRDLTDAVATAIARAYGTFIRRNGGRRVALGRDCRLSSDRLHAAFLAGLLSTGLDVLDVGIGPTPALYWSVFHLDADGGVQITGSHNPGHHNGFKMMVGKRSLHGESIVALKRLIETSDFETGAGEHTHHDLFSAYVADMASRLDLGPHLKRVAIDGGNGTGGPPANALLEALKVPTEALHIEMDGRFPNHHPDPTVEENLVDLRNAVLGTGCDVGIAYDGDADRIGVIDDRGEVLWGDRLLILLAREVLNRKPGSAIVGEVKCSKTLFSDIAQRGGRPVMSAVGHSIIKDRMKTEHAALAGEMSGHIFYEDRWYGFDDAIYVTGRLLEILSHDPRPLSQILSDVPVTFVTPEIRLECPDETKFGVVERAISHYRANYEVVDIDGARIDFGDGWGLIRASNTQPVIVLRAEADTEAGLARIRSEVEGFVASYAGPPAH
jgi:phosphomannomutase/phosphoglucomutase